MYSFKFNSIYEIIRTGIWKYEPFRITFVTKQFVIEMKKLKPTDSELKVLQILWEKKVATVREINDLLNQSKEVGYTTTLKIMQIMLDKGILSRESSGRQHIYKAEVQQTEVQQSLLGRFIDATFKGNATALVMQALGNHDASSEELAQIKALIEEMEKGSGQRPA